MNELFLVTVEKRGLALGAHWIHCEPTLRYKQAFDLVDELYDTKNFCYVVQVIHIPVDLRGKISPDNFFQVIHKLELDFEDLE